MDSSGGKPFIRAQARTLLARLKEPRRFIQALAGPRQAGKTTLARQAVEHAGLASHYAGADEPSLRDRIWIEQQWEAGRRLAAKQQGGARAVLVLDEVQKVAGWSETVKRLWDEDARSAAALHVVLLGSAPLLIQQGLTESLAGRFEIIRVPHWSYPEMKAAFGWDLESFIYFGSYPGAAPLIGDSERWRRYIRDSLIETTISRDVLLMSRVDKPALLRRLFELGCVYSGQMLSFTKLLGQLQDAGNTTTLAHYLDLLRGAGLLEGLHKYAGQEVRRRGSSPKFQVHNNALLSAQGDAGFHESRENPDAWGRLVESAVGASLLNSSGEAGIRVLYWREGNHEVDFVLVRGRAAVAIEVKSGRRRGALPGMAALAARYSIRKKLLVGGGGIPLEEFLSAPAAAWFA